MITEPLQGNSHIKMAYLPENPPLFYALLWLHSHSQVAMWKSAKENLCIWALLLGLGLRDARSRALASWSLPHVGFQLLKCHFQYFKLYILICPFHQGKKTKCRGNTPPYLGWGKLCQALPPSLGSTWGEAATDLHSATALSSAAMEDAPLLQYSQN